MLNGEMSEVMEIRLAKHLRELLAQTEFHFVFGGIDSIFSKTAGFNVPVEYNNLMSGECDLLCGEQSRWSGPDHKNSVQNYYP